MGRRAFTLIEVIVAVAVLAVALLALYALMLSSMRAQVGSQETELAVQAARRRLEELRNLPLEAVLATGPRSTFAVTCDGRTLLAPEDAGREDAGLVELCLPSVLAELGEDLDLNGDGDTEDVPDAGFTVLAVKVMIEWRSGPPSDPPRSFVLRSVLVPRTEER